MITVLEPSWTAPFTGLSPRAHGGPGNATSLPAFEVYNRAFGTGQGGSACAIAVVLTAVILLITFLITKLQPEVDGS